MLAEQNGVRRSTGGAPAETIVRTTSPIACDDTGDEPGGLWLWIRKSGHVHLLGEREDEAALDEQPGSSPGRPQRVSPRQLLLVPSVDPAACEERQYLRGVPPPVRSPSVLELVGIRLAPARGSHLDAEEPASGRQNNATGRLLALSSQLGGALHKATQLKLFRTMGRRGFPTSWPGIISTARSSCQRTSQTIRTRRPSPT